MESMSEHGMWSLSFDTTGIDLDGVRQIFDARFSGYNIHQQYKVNKDWSVSLYWVVRSLADQETITAISEAIKETFNPRNVFIQLSNVAELSSFANNETFKTDKVHDILTEDINREGITSVLEKHALRFKYFKTQGVYLDTKEASLQIMVFTTDREAVIKVATEIGVMNRQREMGIVSGGETKFIKTGHEHTVGGQACIRAGVTLNSVSTKGRKHIVTDHLKDDLRRNADTQQFVNRFTRTSKEPDQVPPLDLQAFLDEAIARGIGALSTLSTLKQDAATASPDLRKRIEAAISTSGWENVTDSYINMVNLLAESLRGEKDSLGLA